MKVPSKSVMTSALAQRKFLTLVTCIAGLSMGNQSCQTTTSTARILKMDVDVGTLNAKSVTLPDGEVVDFPYVVNELFYQEVMKNDHFVINNPITTTTTTTKAMSSAPGAAVLTTTSVSKDAALLQKYGFTKAAASPAEHTLSTGVVAMSDTTTTASTINDPLACLYDLPQATLGGEVDSFALTGGGGVSVGYTSSGASNTTTAGIGGTVNYTASTLDMSFQTTDPLTANVIEVADGVAVQSSINAAVAFPASGVPLGLNFFYTTPITNAITGAMDKGLASVVTKYIADDSATTKTWNDVWESRVVYDPQIADDDTTVAIRGGSRAGMVAGDQFTITNMHYMWSGDPCTSLLRSKIPMTTTPIATIKIIEVGDNVSVATVVSYASNTKIESGALVKISALYVAPTATPTPSPTASPAPAASATPAPSATPATVSAGANPVGSLPPKKISK